MCLFYFFSNMFFIVVIFWEKGFHLTFFFSEAVNVFLAKFQIPVYSFTKLIL